MANENLHKAKEAKNDEFYTQLNDVAEELRHYKEHFKGKVVFCNCDDPTSSAFWRYFHLNFDHLGLKKLISTHYDKKRPTYKMEYTGGDDNNIEAGVKTPLEGNGDFRNQECIDLLEEADIVVTNPPFSLFREYVSVLEEHNKKFLIIGNPNAVTYKEFFPLLKENKVWIGAKPWSSEMYFGVPEEQADYLVKNKKEGSAYVIRNGQILGRAATLWFTNLDIKKRHEKLILWKNYTPAEFPQYDNYDAINVDKVSNIPCDYCESWEVTEEEFKNLSADEWEITREGEFDGEKSFFIIPAANTELRKLLHEHTAGYKEEIEKEISKKMQKNIFIDDSKTGDLQDRRPARRRSRRSFRSVIQCSDMAEGVELVCQVDEFVVVQTDCGVSHSGRVLQRVDFLAVISDHQFGNGTFQIDSDLCFGVAFFGRLHGDVHIGRAAVGHDETASGYAGYHAVSIGGGVNLSQ